MRLCSVKNCGRKHNAHGLCIMHQTRLKRTGDLNRGRHNKPKKIKCTINGCDKPYDSNGFCQMHNWRFKTYGDPNYKPWKEKKCSVENWQRKHCGHGFCQLHLRRKKKNIPLDFEKPKLAKKRYKLKYKPTHPLCDKLGRVLEHRMVLYDDVFGSNLPCFWCGKELYWKKNLCVDHLNHDRHDNRLKNLVPSCNSCNAGRTTNNSQIRKSVYSSNINGPN